MRTRILSFLCLFAFLAAPLAAQDRDPVPTPVEGESPIDIPYQKFVLDNGLTLIVHEDHKTPVVAVNIWYHVGSKNEQTGKTGFAHLFEHLMFNGSENFDDDYFQAMERIGATDLNGTTNRDRTNYFQNVPTNALDVALWMESDRMGHLLGAVDQEKLDEQRGVVQNEKRQGENQPYGKAWGLIAENTYPEGHPYSWTTIGSMEDLNAASLDDVYAWFEQYYGTANATIVIAGDIDAETALDKVKTYFGDIESGPPLAKPQAWVAPRTGEQRMTMEDRVPQSRVYKVWNVPESGHLDRDHLDIAADVLADGKTSRLYKRLVYDDQIATDVNAFINTGEIGSQFFLWATARPGQDLAEVESALDEEVARFLAEGPTAQEIRRVKTQTVAGFVRGAERIGGFGGKSDILAQNEVYAGSPEAYKTYLARIDAATVSDVQNAAQTWLSDGVFVLSVHPFPTYTASEPMADRSGLPAVSEPPAATFPAFQTATLSNGLKVMLVERAAVPLVNFSLLVDAGYAADAFAKPGTASLAMTMLDEGTTSRTALEISEALDLLGANLGTGANLDMASVTLSTLTSELDAALDLYADVILNPAFPESDFERLRKQRIAQIQREKVTPVQMALRVFPGLLYGEGHPYALPLTGSGSEATVNSLTRDDLVGFHQTWFKPNNATLLVVGDVTMGELMPKLEARFGGWARGNVPQKNIAMVAQQPGTAVYLMDRPGSEQSIIFAGHVAPPKGNPDEIAIETMNTILGGSFTSRVNMNLREDKGWSYGAFTLLFDARGQRPFIAYAPVQTDKTAESMAEVLAELTGILNANPVTAAELAKAKQNQTLTLAGQWETNNAVLGSLAEMVRFGLPEDHFATYATRVQGLAENQITAAATEVLHPSNLVWVIVGDRARIEPAIRALGYAEIQYLDGDGNLIDGGTD